MSKKRLDPAIPLDKKATDELTQMSRPKDANRTETILRIVAILVILFVVMIKALPLALKGKPLEEITPWTKIITEFVAHDSLIPIIGVVLLWIATSP